MLQKHTREPIKVLFVRWLNNRFDSLCNLRIIKHLLQQHMRAFCGFAQLYGERKKWLTVVTNHDT